MHHLAKVIEVKNIVPRLLRISTLIKPKANDLSLAAMSIWPLTPVSTILDNPKSSRKRRLGKSQ